MVYTRSSPRCSPLDQGKKDEGNDMRPDEIASLLRRAVRERVLRPGQALHQDDLAKTFGVSRVPLREALRTLVGEGLIVMRPGIGAVVTELKIDELQELYDLRTQLEPPLAAAILAETRGKDIAELADILDRMDALPDTKIDDWANLHYLFHRRMYELSGRPHALRLVTQVLNLVEPYSRMYVHMTGTQEHAQVEHRQIIEALRGGDPDKLQAKLYEAINTARDRLVSATQNPSDAGIDVLTLLQQRTS
jgi:DNA-binding GntR family transcriptional regulator